MTQQTSRIIWQSFLWAVLAVFLVWQAQLLSIHKRLIAADVVSVAVHPRGAQQAQNLTAAEAGQLIGWFNRAGSFRRNAAHGASGCVDYTSLSFALKSGETVSVSSAMRVTRARPGDGLDQPTADYSFRQSNLEHYLKEWDDKAAATGGC